MFLRFKILFYVFRNIIYFKFHKRISFGNRLRVRGSIITDIGNNAEFIIGDNFELTSGLMINPLGRNIKSYIRINSNSRILIGDNVGMSCVTLWAKKSISIGNNVKIGADVLIMDSDMHSLDFHLRRDSKLDASNAKSAPVFIGDDVFVGTRSIIMKGVKIGARSIVAAGSVVTKSIPVDQIWGGNPAVFLKCIDKNEF
ncbi:acyltransferase [Cyclobacterium roseum]|uniref:acyltransferase n=1 Tax=Cyclobacterium roseum TaxID=2666137 RepID=UPI001390D8FA|nr:acyltransferase [Cyclobacterium roseum]